MVTTEVHGSTRRRRALGWTIALSLVTSVGLGALTVFLLLAHGLGYGFAVVLFPETGIRPPDGSQYGLAFALGTTIDVGLATAMAGLAHRTPARGWPPALLSSLVAGVAGLVAATVLLLTLGIDPVDVLLSL